MSVVPPSEGGAPGYPAPPSYPASGGGYPPLPGYPVGGPFVGMQMGPAPGVVYAGFWWRVLGYVVDEVLILVVTLPYLLFLLYLPVVQFLQDFYRAHPIIAGQPAPTPTIPSDLIGRSVALGLVGVLISAAYYGGVVAWKGRTVGQRVVGARVVRVEDGGRLPPGRALARSSIFWAPGVIGVIPVPGLSIVAFLVRFIGLLWVAWDQRKQGLHDKLGRSVVVRAAPVFAGYPVRMSVP